MLVIGIHGRAKSGKSTIAEHLKKGWCFRMVNFADELKEEVLERFPRTLEVLHEFSGHEHELLSCSFAYRPECIREMVFDRKPRGVRELLQEYGTDVWRAEDPMRWVRKWREEAGTGVADVVAADVRFPNEATAIVNANGLLWRVERPAVEDGKEPHESETALRDWKRWDAVIRNVGTLEDLYTQVDMLMTGKAERPRGVDSGAERTKVRA